MRKPMPWRWETVYLLNRSRKWCWTKLVCWVTYDHPVRELADARDIRHCDSRDPDTIRNGACYCGKFKATS